MSIFDAKTNLSKLIELVISGEQVEITNRGRVVAELIAATGKRQVGYGVLAGDLEEFDWQLADAEFNATINPTKFE